jgi:hypothetical protein
MNLQESITHLEKQGWKVNKVGDSFTINQVGRGLTWNYRNPNKGKDHLFDAAGVIHFTNIFSSTKQRTTLKENLKSFSNGKERAHVRNLLKSNDLDRIGELSTKHPTKKEDIWSWD